MLFNSLAFVAFYAVVYTLYRPAPFRWQNRLLLAASYVFYGYWDHRYLALIALSTSVDFLVGLKLGDQPIRRRDVGIAWAWAAAFFLLAAFPLLRPGQSAASVPQMLIGIGCITVVGAAAAWWTSRSSNPRLFALRVSLVVNLGMLAVFKYFNFFVESANAALAGLGVDSLSWHLNLLLPVGISFYTFQTLSYSIDAYRRRVTPTSNFTAFALFVAFFPQLVAGPIERASKLLPQMLNRRSIDWEGTTTGAYLILVGFFKKIVIADGLSPSVDAIFSRTGVGALDVAAATLAFALQIYGDFSGYSAIARGVSRTLGFDLMKNFAVPYGSRSPSEFWRRWHISLSTWLRDYLYIPLGGNRGSSLATYRNLMLTMLLGGLWHGAAWNFVLWGAFHGGILVLYRWLKGRIKVRAPALVSWGIFLSLTLYAWLLFRAGSMSQIAEFTSALFTLESAPRRFSMPPIACLAGIPVLLVLDLIEYRSGDEFAVLRWPSAIRGALYAVLITLTLAATGGLSGQQFIYFQF